MRIGFVGFGEAALHFAKGLVRERSVDVCAYDVMMTDKQMGPPIHAGAEEVGVTLVSSLQSLAERASVLICATSAKSAVSVAVDVARYLTSAHVYADINAASPATKREVADAIGSSQAAFVDVAVMDSVPVHGYQTPLLVSGDGALTFESLAHDLGMRATYVGPEAGTASAVKMSRSVLMKGLTMLLFESLALAKEYGAVDTVLKSLENTLSREALRVTADGLMTRTLRHAKRRITEMREAQETLAQYGIDDLVTNATIAKLKYLDGLQLYDRVIVSPPASLEEALELIDEAQSLQGETRPGLGSTDGNREQTS